MKDPLLPRDWRTWALVLVIVLALVAVSYLFSGFDLR